MQTRKPAQDTDVIIIGGGIIGICIAAYLAEAGKKILVLDRSGICEETSAGNAGALAFSDILPLAHKDMLSQVPGWLRDPLGPLAIPPAYLPRLLPWLWRFLKAGRAEYFEAAVSAQASIMALAEREWMTLIGRLAMKDMLREDGCLELYESDEAFRAAEEGWRLRRRFHIPYQQLEKHEIARYQPGLSDIFTRAVFVPGWKTVSDPQQVGHAVWAHAEFHGARLMPLTATAVKTEEDRIAVSVSNGEKFIGNQVIIAAGAWSRPFAASFGDRVPLETERGYNTTLPAGSFDLQRQLIFPRHGFVITPLDTGLRIGGAVEFGGLKRPPNFARSRAMLEKASRFLPGLKTEGGRQWMGYRPSLPDSLPVIGRSRKEPRVLYAFGHGHLGLTQAAATGRIVRDLLLDRPPPIALEPFAADRFQTR
ncbi:MULTISPECIES: NAD(P)/FAD-dependent oxidoreductase [Chelativorans]|jgi:D-amino-acid dehydrogenase|nr:MULTISPECIES: FAD-binding oxidoreductase [Chelativorans]